MKKVLLLANSVSSVRAKIYSLVAEKYDFTVAYMGTVAKNLTCKNIKLSCVDKGCVKYYKPGIRKMLKQYDVVIFPMDIHSIDIDIMLLMRHPCKMIAWGIGVPASYTVKFDDPKVHNFIPYFIRKADAVLFYSNYPREKYIAEGYDKEKMFVANNTVSVAEVPKCRDRDSILFVGTLYPAKKTELLIEAYARLAGEGIDLMPLNVVGDGPNREALEELAGKLKVGGRINFCGAIYDDDVLKDYFEKAYAVLSPGQAGLTVLKAMGYGVPFVTSKDAYTGGERLNIEDGKNGVLMNSPEDIGDVIRDIHVNPGKYVEMGENAFDYYRANRRPEQMVQGFLDAIRYVTE